MSRRCIVVGPDDHRDPRDPWQPLTRDHRSDHSDLNDRDCSLNDCGPRGRSPSSDVFAVGVTPYHLVIPQSPAVLREDCLPRERIHSNDVIKCISVSSRAIARPAGVPKMSGGYRSVDTRTVAAAGSICSPRLAPIELVCSVHDFWISRSLDPGARLRARSPCTRNRQATHRSARSLSLALVCARVLVHVLVREEQQAPPQIGR